MIDMVATFPIARSQPATKSEVSNGVSVTPEKGFDSVAFARRARMSGLAQPPYLATQLDIQRIQNALRASERGDAWLLMTIFRDMVVSYTHLGAEWAKRKCVIVGQPQSLVPYDSDNQDDVIAAEVIQIMIDNCRNWSDALDHLLDATLYPIAAAEKIYRPVELAEAEKFKHPVRLLLKEIAPIDHILECYKIPYAPNYAESITPAAKFNPDDWESWLRFYDTTPTGMLNTAYGSVYKPEEKYHVIHRGNMLSPTIPPNFGGHLRACLFWAFLASQDRDWWAMAMQKYGSPFLVGKADAQQKDTINFLQSAFAMATQIGGIVVDKKAEITAEQTNATDTANAHKTFNDYCNCEISKIVVGQVLSSTPKNTGLGSGMAAQAEEVREDIRQSDTMKLSDTLMKQVFKQFLEVNGYRGHPPHIFWGGMREGAAGTFAKTLSDLGSGGYELDDRGLRTASTKFGYSIQRREPPPSDAGGVPKPNPKPK